MENRKLNVDERQRFRLIMAQEAHVYLESSMPLRARYYLEIVQQPVIWAEEAAEMLNAIVGFSSEPHPDAVDLLRQLKGETCPGLTSEDEAILDRVYREEYLRSSVEGCIMDNAIDGDNEALDLVLSYAKSLIEVGLDKPDQ